MPVRLTRERVVAVGLTGALVTVGLLSPAAPAVVVALVVAALVAGAVVAWRVHPAWTLSAALVLSVDGGELGEPRRARRPGSGSAAPRDGHRRRAAAGAADPRPAAADVPAGALDHGAHAPVDGRVGASPPARSTARAEQFELLERVGLLPFALFLVAPVVFETEKHRRILLGALVGLGAYLGFTALMETLNFRALVFPSFINDGSLGTHADRARGPFLEAVTNGAGLYVGIIGATIALITWSKPTRAPVRGGGARPVQRRAPVHRDALGVAGRGGGHRADAPRHP